MNITTNTERHVFCPLTARLLESIESPVEHSRKAHTKKMQRILQKLEQDMEVAVLKLKLSELSLQRRILFKLKTEIIHHLESVLMAESRKSYLLHQLSNAQDIDELVSLIREVNHLQAFEESVILSGLRDLGEIALHRRDLLFIAQCSTGIIVSRQSFTQIAGIFIDDVDQTTQTQLRKLSVTEDFKLLNHELTINESLFTSLRSVEAKGKQLIESTVAVTGTTGDIMSLTSEIMAHQVKKLILLHHSPVEVSLKFQKTILKIIRELLNSTEESPLINIIRAHWSPTVSIVDFLNIEAVKEVLQASTDLTLIREADIILCGSCPTAGFLTLDYFQTNAVIIDLTSTSAFDQEMLSRIRFERPDLAYHVIFQKKNETSA